LKLRVLSLSWSSEEGEETRKMGKRGHSEEEILRVLREAESGETVVEVCRKHGISQQSFYLWKINTLVERARYSSHCSASLFFWLCSSSV
jgi:transposase-like protein